MESLHDILDSPALAQYKRFFVECGLDDFEYLMSEDSNGWNSMLDVVSEEMEADGVRLKPGHRMMILSRLRKAQVARQNLSEEQQEHEQMIAQKRKQQEMSNGRFRPPEQHLLSGDVRRDDGDSLLWEGMRCIRAHWLCQLGTLFFVLAVSLVLWALEENINTTLGRHNHIAGGWLFLRTVYTLGFIFSGLVFGSCAIAFMRRDSEVPMEAPSCSSCFSPETVGSVTACTCCACDLEQNCPDCSGAACELPPCSCEGCYNSIECPRGTCDALENCCTTFYKVICCKFSITIT